MENLLHRFHVWNLKLVFKHFLPDLLLIETDMFGVEYLIKIFSINLNFWPFYVQQYYEATLPSLEVRSINKNFLVVVGRRSVELEACECVLEANTRNDFILCQSPNSSSDSVQKQSELFDLGTQSSIADTLKINNKAISIAF